MKKKVIIKIAEEIIHNRIYVIRKHKVMIDFDLAELYQVETRNLNQAVKRNIGRFPKDFMFRLTKKEWDSLRSQFVILENSNMKRGKHSKFLPYAFTEQGVSMLSGVLNSPRAIAVNIQIMRIFVQMRQMIGKYKQLREKIEKIEKSQAAHDQDISSIYKIIQELLSPVLTKRAPLGFKIKGS